VTRPTRIAVSSFFSFTMAKSFIRKVFYYMYARGITA
jgi:hypothetical protein